MVQEIDICINLPNFMLIVLLTVGNSIIWSNIIKQLNFFFRITMESRDLFSISCSLCNRQIHDIGISHTERLKSVRSSFFKFLICCVILCHSFLILHKLNDSVQIVPNNLYFLQSIFLLLLGGYCFRLSTFLYAFSTRSPMFLFLFSESDK